MHFTIPASLQAASQARPFPVSGRAALLAGCALSVAIPLLVGSAAAPASAPDLARMLRMMAWLKGVIALASLGVVWWRLAFPVRTSFAVAYAGGTWLMAAASVLLWQLAHLLAAGALFHAGMALVLLSAWRDMPTIAKR